MPFVQFRIHPSVGIARMGDSEAAYYLASEFPQFLQEEFPTLRLHPKPLTHPLTFFPDAATDPTRSTESKDAPASFKIPDTAQPENRFRDTSGRIFPQAARFRVFAYVYDNAEVAWPSKVFEVTTAEANILWKVNLANKKSERTAAPAGPDENMRKNFFFELNTDSTALTCKRLRPKPGYPNLGYIFLERDEPNTKFTGRLHVIGNEGEMHGAGNPGDGAGTGETLWSKNWHDSAGDGPVEAVITPTNNGAELRAKIGVQNVSDVRYLDQDNPLVRPGTTGSIKAAPAWVVVGCPDYSPDMGHFVSLWDLACSQAINNLDSKNASRKPVVEQPGKHRLIRDQGNTETYKRTDYLIHIHPQLCLFKDVRFVSGDAYGLREVDLVEFDRAHNKHPGTSPPIQAGSVEKVLNERVAHGGIRLDAREAAKKKDLQSHTALKVKDPSRPIDEWVKIAIFKRLRKPGNLYAKRKFLVSTSASGASTHQSHVFPRKLGRRMDYDKDPGAGSDKGKYYRFPPYYYHPGNLRFYHEKLKSKSGTLCGGKNSPPTLATHPADPDTGTPYTNNELKLLDDMFWTATYEDMPLLRELAYPHRQYDNFDVWQGDATDVRSDNIFGEIASKKLQTSFADATKTPDAHFADLLLESPLYAPTMLDMAHLGSMLGGSFIPGIEVGREGGIATNWCLFHGATPFLPDVRFKLAGDAKDHTPGTLTKDLAIPWSHDYAACDEEWWPTSRPGMVTTNGDNLVRWLIEDEELKTHLGVASLSRAEIDDKYWKALGFVRRNASDEFIEQEQTWRKLVDLTLTGTDSNSTDLSNYVFTAKNIGAEAPDRHVVLGISLRTNGGAPTISSVTIGGLSATQLVRAQNGDCWVAIYIAAVPTGVTADIGINTSAPNARCALSVWRMTGADAPTAPITFSVNTGDPLSGTIDVEKYGAGVAVALTDAASTWTWTGLGKDADFQIGSEASQHSSAHRIFLKAKPGFAVSADPSTAASQVMSVAVWKRKP